MSFLSFIIPPGDRWILLAWFLLCLVSLAVLWSVTEPIHGPYEELDPGVSKSVFFRQIYWMMIGFCALVVASRIPLRYLDNIATPLFLFSILLLVLILLVGPRIGGARRWLVIGQPDAHGNRHQERQPHSQRDYLAFPRHQLLIARLPRPWQPVPRSPYSSPSGARTDLPSTR